MTGAQAYVLASVRAHLGDEAADDLAQRWHDDGVDGRERRPTAAELARWAAWRMSPHPRRRMIAIQRLAHLGYAVTLERRTVNEGTRELIADARPGPNRATVDHREAA